MNKCYWLLLLALGFPSFLAADSKDTSQENLKIAQETVKVAAVDVQTKLDAIIREMRENGLADMDAPTLHKMLSKLGTLTESEMQSVITTLKKADSTNDHKEQTKNLTDVYVEQGKISEELKHMAASFQQTQEIDAISQRVRNLLRRQMDALRDTKGQLAKPDADSFIVLDGSQKSILQDVFRLPAVLNPNGDVPDEIKAILKDASDYLTASGLSGESQKAARQVTEKKLDQALPAQQKCVEILNVLFEKVLAIDEGMTRLEQAKEQLEAMIQDESNLSQRSERAQANKADAERQANLQDDLDIAHQELKNLSLTAANKLNEAQKDIQKSQDELNRQPNGKTAAQPQKDATEALKQAEADIDKQLSQMAAEEQKSDQNQLKDLQNLANEAQKAADEEKQLTQKPDQAKQQDVAQQTEQLQQDSLPLDQKAADMLAKAEDQMQQKDANQAADNLQKAAQELNQQAQQMQQQIVQEEQDQKNEQQLGQMEQDLEKVNQDLAQNQDHQQDAQQMQQMAQQMQQMEQQQAGKNDNEKQQMEQAKNNLNNAAQQARQNPQQAARLNQQTMKQLQQMQMAMKSRDNNMKGVAQFMKGNGPNNQSMGAVVGALKPKDRAAMSAYDNEKIPAGYEPMVKQYRQNLSEEAP